MITEEQIDAYLNQLRQQRPLADSSLRGYRRELLALVERQIHLESDAVLAFVTTAADGTTLKPRSRNHRLVVLRGFCRFLVSRQVLTEDPTESMARVKIPEETRTVLTPDELERLLTVLSDDTCAWRRIRDETIVRLLFCTGLRIGELHRLDLAQVDLVSRVLRRVRRKGGGLIDAVLNEQAETAMRCWLLARPESSEQAVFVSRLGRRLSIRMVQKRLAQLGEAAGLSLPCHPHQLRHAHATSLLGADVNIELIRQSLNHRSLLTTVRYLHGDQALLRQALERLPRLRTSEQPEEGATAEG